MQLFWLKGPVHVHLHVRTYVHKYVHVHVRKHIMYVHTCTYVHNVCIIIVFLCSSVRCSAIPGDPRHTEQQSAPHVALQPKAEPHLVCLADGGGAILRPSWV